jgi:hypothetical protein
MGGVSARRLRKVPAVMLPRVPEPQRLLSAVRLFDPGPRRSTAESPSGRACGWPGRIR